MALPLIPLAALGAAGATGAGVGAGAGLAAGAGAAGAAGAGAGALGGAGMGAAAGTGALGAAGAAGGGNMLGSLGSTLASAMGTGGEQFPGPVANPTGGNLNAMPPAWPSTADPMGDAAANASEGDGFWSGFNRVMQSRTPYAAASLLYQGRPQEDIQLGQVTGYRGGAAPQNPTNTGFQGLNALAMQAGRR